MGMPTGSRSLFMYYRRDVLAAAKLPVPATWDDLLLVAQTLNGSDFSNDGRSDYTMCLQIAGAFCSVDSASVVPVVLAQHTQVEVSGQVDTLGSVDMNDDRHTHTYAAVCFIQAQER